MEKLSMEAKRKTRIYRSNYSLLYKQSASDFFKKELPCVEYETLLYLWKKHNINNLLLNDEFEIIRVRYTINHELTAQRYSNGTWCLKYTWI